MIQVITLSIITIIASMFGFHGFTTEPTHEQTPPNPQIKCEEGMHGELVDLSWNPVLENENIENVCISNSINAQFVHDWYNSGCLWTKDTEWADHIKKVKLVNGTLLVCNSFNGFMASYNQYNSLQWGEVGDEYVKSKCVDLSTEVDGQCYVLVNNNPNSILNMFKNSTTSIEIQNYTGVKQ